MSTGIEGMKPMNDTSEEKSRAKWVNSAKRRRVHAKFRAHLCAILSCPFDSCYSTGELLREARRQKAQDAATKQEWAAS